MGIALMLLLAACAAPAASASCSTATSRGACTEIRLAESQCYNSEANYAAMRERCCPSPASQQCCLSPGQRCYSSSGCSCLSPSDHQWSRQPCTRASSSFLSSPSTHILSLIPQPIDCSSFSLTASWPQFKNVSGYTVVISRREEVVAQFFANDPGNTNITLTSVCYDAGDTMLDVELWKEAVGSPELVDVSSVKRKDCYSLFRDDPILQRSRCGPNISDKLDTSQVQFHSEGDRDGLVRTTISWPRVEGAMSYELRLKNGRTHYTRFNATRTTEVTLGGLNQSISYSIRINPYMECVGMYSEQRSRQPCTGDPFSIPLSVSTPSSDASSAGSTTPTVLPSILVSRPPPAAPIPSSSLMNHPPTPAHPALIAGMAVALVALLLITLLLVCAVRYHRLHLKPRANPPIVTHHPLPSPTLSTASSSDTSSHYGYITQEVMNQLPLLNVPINPTPSVWVLYSLHTPKEQELLIHDILLGGLAREMTVQTPGTICDREMIREWLETGILEANAVLLVCNDEFYEEWRSEGDGYGGVQMGREAKMLKNGVKSSVLTKFAYVHFEMRDCDFDRHYPKLLSPFIRKRFSLAGNRSTVLDSIAKFVLDLPKFELDKT